MDTTIHHLTDETYAEAAAEPANPRWPLERVLFALAATITLLSVILALTVSEWVLLLAAVVAVNQWLFVLPARARRQSSCAARATCARRSTKTLSAQRRRGRR